MFFLCGKKNKWIRSPSIFTMVMLFVFAFSTGCEKHSRDDKPSSLVIVGEQNQVQTEIELLSPQIKSDSTSETSGTNLKPLSVISFDSWQEMTKPEGIFYEFSLETPFSADHYRYLKIRVITNEPTSKRSSSANKSASVTKIKDSNKSPEQTDRQNIHNQNFLIADSTMRLEVVLTKKGPSPYPLTYRIGNIIPESNLAENTVLFDFKYRSEWHGTIQSFQICFLNKTAAKWKLAEVSLLPYPQSDVQFYRHLSLNRDIRLSRTFPLPSKHYFLHEVKPQEKLYLSFGFANNDKKCAPQALKFTTLVEAINCTDQKEFIKTVSPEKMNCWSDFEIDLSLWQGQTTKITCTVDFFQPRLKEHSMFALWTQPYIIRPSSQKDLRKNFIIVSLDTLHSDFLGCYGNPDSISPYLDRFSRHSQLYTEAFSHAPCTGASHASLLTSLYPSQHGLTEVHNQLKESIRTLALELQERQYVTAAVTGGVRMAATTGLSKGFIMYETKISDGTSIQKSFLPLLKKFETTPHFFLYHTYHIHAPYRYNHHFTPYFGGNREQKDLGRKVLSNPQSDEISDHDKKQLIALYTTGIREMDSYLAALFSYLKERRAKSDTAVIVLSDHGEQFGEHDHLYGHCNSLYDSLLRVPLIICNDFSQKNKGSISFQVTGLKEIMPSILQIVDGSPGKKVAPLSTQLIFSEMNYNNINRPHTERKISVRDKLFKCIYDRDEKTKDYYAISSNPEENKPVVDDSYQRDKNRMDHHLDSYLTQYGAAEKNGAKILLDEDTRNQLQALGYLP